MEETEDKLPKEYLEGFNIGYTFSKSFPDSINQLLKQNNLSIPENELSQTSGIIHGINQYVKEQEMEKQLIVLKEIRNENDFDKDLGHEIE
jgi:hypothetical protein